MAKVPTGATEDATPSDEGGGYDYQFVNTPSDMLVCKICHFPSREPYLSGCCGHTFCKSCLEGKNRATATSISHACPVCHSCSEKFATMPNKQVDRAVRSLHVFCTNKEKGCEWQGEVNNIINHLQSSNGCIFEKVACSNDCGTFLQRQYLTSHIENECACRKVDCQYCHIAGEHQFIEGEHKEQCPRFSVPCPNKCEIHEIPREDIDKHREVCPLEEVACPNECGITMQQQYLTSHVEEECVCRKIACQYCHITEEYQFIEDEHKEQCPKVPIPCPNKCEVGSVLRGDVEEHMKMCPLELIQCEYHVVGCEERIVRKDQTKHNKEKIEEHLAFAMHKLTDMQSNVAIVELNSSQELAAAKQQLMQELATNERKHEESLLQIKKSSALVSYGWGIFCMVIIAIVLAVLAKFYDQKLLQLENDLATTTTDLRGFLAASEDHMYWLQTLFSKASKLSFGDQVVPVIVKISEYSKKYKDNSDWLSTPFYTHNKGYKMCLNVNAAGGLSVQLYLMKGPYDNQLKWPLKGQCEVKLLNQISDDEHHSRSTAYDMDVSKKVTKRERSEYYMWYDPNFITDKSIRIITATRQYLKNDMIFLQVDCKLHAH
ncbi:TNF receptor-associated factor 4-like [Dysidea avara]|uniref:TNF receptor-associated factor 4-like n=1 Tax=Dysidea avara TaxID=196820 RepID=UPI0033216C22